MAGENDKLINDLVEMLGDNPEEKIAEALGKLSKIMPDSQALPAERKNLDAGLDINALLSLQNAFSGGNENDDTRLLSAIKPYLSERRKPQVDHLLKLLKLANIAEKAGGMDILKNLKL